MGTRSLTSVIETYKGEDGKKKKDKIMTMYRQFDGYPSGMGEDLAQFINSGTLVNGIGLTENKTVFNGAGCFAASLVANMKDGAGGIYLYNPKVKDAGQVYEYEIECDFDTNEFTFNVIEVGYVNKAGAYINKKRKLFSGNPLLFDEWLKKHEKEQEA